MCWFELHFSYCYLASSDINRKCWVKHMQYLTLLIETLKTNKILNQNEDYCFIEASCFVAARELFDYAI